MNNPSNTPSRGPKPAALPQAIIRGIRKAQRVWAAGCDRYLHIQTSDAGYSAQYDRQKGWPFALTLPGVRYDDAHVYGAIDYLNILRVARKLNLGPQDHFYDLGCGKGRVVCCLARYTLGRVVGIEIDEGLCQFARRNAASLRSRKTDIEIRCEDAAVADLSRCTILFMANPFGPATLRAVLENLRQSLEANPRQVTIVYYHSAFKGVLQECDWIKALPGLRTLIGPREIGFFSAGAKTTTGCEEAARYSGQQG